MHFFLISDAGTLFALSDAVTKNGENIMEKKLPCDFIEDGILVVDRTMKVVFANTTLLKSCGLFGDDMTGIPCHMAFRHSLLPCAEKCLHREVFSSGKSFTTTYIHNTPDGKERIVEVNATPVFDEKGEITQMVEIFRDVTDLSRKEAGLKDQRDFLRAILDAFSGGVIIVDLDMKVVMANKHYLSREHLKLDEATGRHCYEAFRRSSKPCSERGEGCPVQDTFKTGLPAEAIHTYVDEKGNERYIALKTYPLKDKNGTVVQVVETLHDITEKTENEIKERIRILELKEEVEMLREELQRGKGSREVMSSVSP